MTAMEAIRRRVSAKKDVTRLRLQLAFAQDSGKRTEAENIAAAIKARLRMREMETAEASRVLSLLEPEAGYVIYLRRIRNLTVRQTAGEAGRTTDSVRGIQRRGEKALESITSELDRNTEYLALCHKYQSGLK